MGLIISRREGDVVVLRIPPQPSGDREVVISFTTVRSGRAQIRIDAPKEITIRRTADSATD